MSNTKSNFHQIKDIYLSREG